MGKIKKYIMFYTFEKYGKGERTEIVGQIIAVPTTASRFLNLKVTAIAFLIWINN